MRALTAAVLLLAFARTGEARTLLTQKEALALAFPGQTVVQRETAYLTDEQVKKAETLGKVKIPSKVWSFYVGVSTGGTEGYAYFESHVVRSMTETFMAALNPDGSLRFVELLAFEEPEDYLPSPRWLAQFKGRSLKDDLMVHRTIRNQTGASLTSEALSAGVRRVLAVHALIRGQNPILGPKR